MNNNFEFSYKPIQLQRKSVFDNTWPFERVLLNLIGRTVFSMIGMVIGYFLLKWLSQ
jgi:hypothetical protein